MRTLCLIALLLAAPSAGPPGATAGDFPRAPMSAPTQADRVVAAADAPAPAPTADRPADAGPRLGYWQRIMYAVALMILALALMVLEFFIVSGGLIAIGAVIAAGAAIGLAFSAGDGPGWAMTVALPLAAIPLLNWSMTRLGRSRLAVQAQITDTAGYRETAERVGAVPGARGVLLTDARPTGRARFADGVCDVSVQGGLLRAGDAIVVRAIEGPVVHVAPADPERPATIAEPPEPGP